MRRKNKQKNNVIQIANNKGITLIALIITIILMLILVAVSIRTVINSGLFGHVRNATEQWGDAQKNEANIGDDIDKWRNENGYTSGGNNPIIEKWDKNKVTVIPSTAESKNPVPLPNGYVVSKIEGEMSVNTGLVIYQIPESEIEGIDWSADSDNNGILDVQEKYNQFVWIPVSNPNEMFGTDENGNSLGKLYDFNIDGPIVENWTETDGVMSWTSPMGFREPDTVVSGTNSSGTTYKGDEEHYNLEEFKEQIQGEFEELRKSIETYRGFYIGRYETGSQNGTIGKVVRGNSNISSDWYRHYQKNKTIATDINITSSMIWGCQWDAMIKWLQASGAKTWEELINSTDWGHYSGSYRPTGSSDTYKANNIYDITGNVWDLTMEVYNTSQRVCRGGSYGYRYSIYRRFLVYPADSSTLYGSRATLVL